MNRNPERRWVLAGCCPNSVTLAGLARDGRQEIPRAICAGAEHIDIKHRVLHDRQHGSIRNGAKLAFTKAVSCPQGRTGGRDHLQEGRLNGGAADRFGPLHQKAGTEPLPHRQARQDVWGADTKI